MEFEAVVRKRRMVRNYLPGPIARDQIERVMEVARKAPSAGFSQGQSFVVVTDDSKRRKIAELANEQLYVSKGLDPWISVAPVHVVVCTSEEVYRARYREPDKTGPRGEQIEWPVPYWFTDAGCSMMLLLLAAVNEGLAAGFLGLSRDGYAALKDMLGIPEDVTPIGLVTMGKPAPDKPSPSLRRGWRQRGEVVHFEQW